MLSYHNNGDNTHTVDRICTRFKRIQNHIIGKYDYDAQDKASEADEKGCDRVARRYNDLSFLHVQFLYF